MRTRLSPFSCTSDTSGAFGGATYGKLVDDWLSEGYAGAQGWAFSDTAGAFNWSNGKANVKTWASNHLCYIHY